MTRPGDWAMKQTMGLAVGSVRGLRAGFFMLAGFALALAAGCGEKAKLNLGGACQLNSDCKSPLLCKFGACTQACAESRDCEGGAQCVRVDGVGVCQLPGTERCKVGTAPACLAPLVCAPDGMCRNACGAQMSCLPDAVCIAGFCMPAGIDGGASALDGGLDSGATGDRAPVSQGVEAGDARAAGGDAEVASQAADTEPAVGPGPDILPASPDILPAQPDADAAPAPNPDLLPVQPDTADAAPAPNPDAPPDLLVFPDLHQAPDADAMAGPETSDVAVPDAPPTLLPQILSIEGNGTQTPVAPRSEDLANWSAHLADRRPAGRRISSTDPVLLVSGTALDQVTTARLRGQTGQGDHDMTIEEKTMTNLKLRWPSTLLVGGSFLLSLAAPSGLAEAQVFFLQGEKGDPGDSLFSCAGNDCSTTKNVSVNGLFTAAGGLMSGGMSFAPETTRTINVNSAMTADQIQTAIDGISKYIPYGVTVTLQFADGTYTLNHQLTFRGFYGGGTLTIQGNPGESPNDTGHLHTDQAVILNFGGQVSNGLYLRACSLWVRIRNLKIMVNTNSGTAAAVYGVDATYVTLGGSYLVGTSISGGYLATQAYGGVQMVSLTYFENASTALYAAGATILSASNASTGTPPYWALVAAEGGLIAKEDANQPAGAQKTTSGGEIR